MEKIFRISLKILSTSLVVLIVILAVLLAGVRFIGLTPYTVLSGSMEPTYHVGSVIYVKSVKPAELKIGDPLTFRLSSGVVATHRIIEIVNDDGGLAFRTKGDANKNIDGLTPASAVIGKPVFTIPYLGFVSSFIQKPKSLICVVGFSVIVLLLSNLVDALLSNHKKSELDLSEEQNIG